MQKPSPAFPPQVVKNIIDILACHDGPDLKATKACACTCKSVLPLCRRHIFASVVILNMENLISISKVLNGNPEISTYVRHVALGHNIVEPSKWEVANESNLKVLQEFPKSIDTFSLLKSVYIKHGPEVSDWIEIRPEIQNIISRLIQAPTLTSLTLKRLANIPMSYFFGVSQKLCALHLDQVTISDTDDLPSTSPAQSIVLQQYSCGRRCFPATQSLIDVRTSAGAPLFYFSGLEQLRIHVEEKESSENPLPDTLTQILSLPTKTVPTLELEGSEWNDLVALLEHVDSIGKIPKRLVLRFPYWFGLTWVCEALETTFDHKPVEELVVCMKGRRWVNDIRRFSEDWGRGLDACIGSRREWPNIKSVAITFDTSAAWYYDSKKLFMKHRFRKLSEDDSIAFEMTRDNVESDYE